MGRRIKRGRVDIQELYNSGKMSTDEFFLGVSNLIKTYLMRSLICKGYYKNGERQANYDQEDIEDCYTYLLTKIIDKYDPEKGTLASFVRMWIRGYGTTVIQKQVRQHKYVKSMLPLDLNLQKSISDEHKDTSTFDDLCEYLDNNFFGSGHTHEFTLEEIKNITEKISLKALNLQEYTCTH